MNIANYSHAGLSEENQRILTLEDKEEHLIKSITDAAIRHDATPWGVPRELLKHGVANVSIYDPGKGISQMAKDFVAGNSFRNPVRDMMAEKAAVKKSIPKQPPAPPVTQSSSLTLEQNENRTYKSVAPVSGFMGAGKAAIGDIPHPGIAPAEERPPVTVGGVLDAVNSRFGFVEGQQPQQAGFDMKTVMIGAAVLGGVALLVKAAG